MTVRLMLLDRQGRRVVEDYDTGQEALEAAPSKWMARVGLSIVALAEPEQATWNQVSEGDEVIAPDSTAWTVETVTLAEGLWRFDLVNVHDGQELTTTPRPDATVQRRPGPIAAVRQMLAEAGMATRRVS